MERRPDLELTPRESALLDWFWRGRAEWATGPLTAREIAETEEPNIRGFPYALHGRPDVVRRVLTGLTFKGALERIELGPRRHAWRLSKRRAS